MNDPTLSAPARDFYLARQPILDRKQALFGYELLFRSTAAGPANFVRHRLGAGFVLIHHCERSSLAR